MARLPPSLLSLFPRSRFVRRRTIPVGRVTGARGMPVRSHPQCIPVLAVREVEPDWSARLSGSWHADAQLRHAPALRNLSVLRSRVRLLSETFQRYANWSRQTGSMCMQQPGGSLGACGRESGKLEHRTYQKWVKGCRGGTWQQSIYISN